MTPASHSTCSGPSLVFRRRSPEGERFLVDGRGFVSASLEEATRFPVRPDITSFFWKRFDGPLDQVSALVPLEIRETSPDTAAICWGTHEWEFPRFLANPPNLRQITFPLIRHLLVPGGPFSAVRVLWRDTDEHVQNFGVVREVRGARLAEKTT